MKKKSEVTNQEILQAINSFSGHVEKRFDGVETRLDGVETRLDGVENEVKTIKNTMVTKLLG